MTVSGTDVYWTTVSGKLMKSSADAPGITLVDGLTSPAAVVVLGDTVYWSDAGGISSTPTSGGSVNHLGKTKDVASTSLLVADQSRLFWVNPHGDGETLVAYSGSSIATVADQIGIISHLFSDGDHFILADSLTPEDGGPAYGALVSVDKASGGFQVLQTQGVHFPRAVAADSNNLYWLDMITNAPNSAESLMKAPKAGGPPTQIVSLDKGGTYYLATDESYAYLTGYQDLQPYGTGFLRRVRLADGVSEVVHTTDNTTYGTLQVTSDAIYLVIGLETLTDPQAPTVIKLCKSSLPD